MSRVSDGLGVAQCAAGVCDAEGYAGARRRA